MPLTKIERELMVEVLIFHQRKDAQYCMCGWGELGKSHSEHVIQVFELVTGMIWGENDTKGWAKRRRCPIHGYRWISNDGYTCISDGCFHVLIVEEE